jgi:phosphoglycerate dehydrogenase-like enzyme
VAVAPRLRVIGHCGGEVKGRFATALFSRLTITNAPAPMAAPVAELAVTFLLYAARNVDAYRDALRGRSNAIHGRLHRDGAGDETLRGRTVGLLGFGKIGRAVAGLLAPFGARLLVHDPYVPARDIRRAGATPAPWRRVLARSRDLVLAAALTDRTRGLLDARALALLPDGATVINVARGGLVDLRALTREVRSGRLRCALDVTDPEEPLPLRHPLRRARGAILTPHVGAAQRAVRHRIARIVIDDLERFFRGRAVRNRVTPSMLRRMT